uniref:Uncharacterized protein n=1 Tax=Trichogramma kaykai TaxID=54128 RepID=A0ABD2X4Y2_9HYME
MLFISCRVFEKNEKILERVAVEILYIRDPPGLNVSREEVRTSRRVGPAAGEAVTPSWVFQGSENNTRDFR